MNRIPWLIFLCGSLVAFVWEVFQMPFFDAGNLTPSERIIRCGIASLGDGLILLAAYRLAALKGGANWLWQPSKSALAIYLAFGLAVAVAVELFATSLPRESMLSWSYSDLMPVEPVTGLALVPIAMWIIVPLLTLAFVKFARPGPG